MSKTALIEAVKQLDLDEVKRNLAKTPALKAWRSEQGFDLLQFCCARPSHGEAALADRQLRLARWLVGEGFDPRAIYLTKPGEDGEEEAAELSLVFFAVARAQNNRLARYFLELGARPEAMFAAAWWGNWEIVPDLVRFGADLNVVVGATPLHMAVSLLRRGVDTDPKLASRRVKTVKELLRLGADPNIRDQRGDTVLHIVLERDFGAKILTLLLTHGANPDIPGRDGRTARQIAARKRDKQYHGALTARE
jgi:hypothetical protein